VGAGDIGWSAVSLESSMAFLEAWVVPDARRQGVGGALFTRLSTFAHEHGIGRLNVAVKDGDTASMEFALRRGMTVDGGGSLGNLDLTTLAGTRSVATVSGLVLTSLAERPDLITAIYRLDMAVRPEIPVLANERQPSFEAWNEEVSGASSLLPELSIIALRNDVVVGWLHILENGDSSVFIGMTAVDPGLRRMGIGRSLKEELARRAAAAGRVRIETYNDGENDRIRALNESLGYVYGPRLVLLRGPSAAAGAADAR
jgi:GNAT superfamily N-acetyltransferase